MELKKTKCESCGVTITGYGRSHMLRNYDDHMRQQHRMLYNKLHGKPIVPEPIEPEPIEPKPIEPIEPEPEPIADEELEPIADEESEPIEDEAEGVQEELSEDEIIIQSKKGEDGKFSETDLRDLNKKQQVFILEEYYGVSKEEIKKLKREQERIDAILEIQKPLD